MIHSIVTENAIFALYLVLPVNILMVKGNILSLGGRVGMGAVHVTLKITSLIRTIVCNDMRIVYDCYKLRKPYTAQF